MTALRAGKIVECVCSTNSLADRRPTSPGGVRSCRYVLPNVLCTVPRGYLQYPSGRAFAGLPRPTADRIPALGAGFRSCRRRRSRHHANSLSSSSTADWRTR